MGKLGIVVGFAAGYVLGSRAGRERYNQIKQQFLKVWNADPVQKQVNKAQDIAKDAAAQLPNAVWNGAVKLTETVKQKVGSGTSDDAGDDRATANDVAYGKAKSGAATSDASDDTATSAKASSESTGN